ncbi:hypothetical protein K3U93_18555 [Mycobacterium malmoense]|uniref:hypothetical protein n=1 Tax=Mycobacterium malmoense TaxID=1780 RepID=UPI0015939941|nr:hypothetical protein [Mycobacterium malmoense]QZA16636.1 hypothetical protein K3U93_18555 [Mycobacterium malmoense]UNB93436.1 hypothetical protein H5T25_18540 [Mycobacterium malmoense]
MKTLVGLVARSRNGRSVIRPGDLLVVLKGIALLSHHAIDQQINQADWPRRFDDVGQNHARHVDGAGDHRTLFTKGASDAMRRFRCPLPRERLGVHPAPLRTVHHRVASTHPAQVVLGAGDALGQRLDVSVQLFEPALLAGIQLLAARCTDTVKHPALLTLQGVALANKAVDPRALVIKGGHKEPFSRCSELRAPERRTLADEIGLIPSGCKPLAAHPRLGLQRQHIAVH